MSDWRKRGKKTDEVVYFPGATAEELNLATSGFVWDLDKTYLDTHFKTFKGLWRTATEKANQKKNIPGTAELVRFLKFSWGQKQSRPFPLFFITASPPQLEENISKKFEIDGVRPLGVFCKDNLPNLRPKRLWRLSKHVGYKLQALMQMRSYLAGNVGLYLFGDDGESDSIIYSLFSDICARRLNSEDIRKILSHFSVLDDQIDQILKLQENGPTHDPVKKIYINLAEDTDADYYLKFGRRCLPTYNSLQLAIDLHQEKLLGADYIHQIAATLLKDYDYTLEEIEWSIEDLIRRQRLSHEGLEEVFPLLTSNHVLRKDYKPQIPARSRAEIDSSYEPWVVERVEYLKDYR